MFFINKVFGECMRRRTVERQGIHRMFLFELSRVDR